MFFNFLKKRPKVKIGFDINPDGITGIVLNQNQDKFFVQNIVHKRSDTSLIQNGIIVNSSKIQEILKMFLEEDGFNQDSEVCISIPGNNVVINTLTFPNIPEQELKIILAQEIEKYSPLPVAEINYDFEIIRTINDSNDNVKEIEVAVVIVPKTLIKSYADLFYNIGFNVTAVDLAPFAAIKTLANEELIDDSESLAISVFIGYENVDLNIIYKGMPVFFYNIPFGKISILNSMAIDMEITLDEAEKLLLKTMLVVPGMDVALDLQMSKAANSVRPVYNNISGEVLKIIEFYNSGNSDNIPLSKIILSGPGACVRNIDKYFTHRTKIESVVCNSVKKLDFSQISSASKFYELNNFTSSQDFDEISLSLKLPVLTVSAGLALKG